MNRCPKCGGLPLLVGYDHQPTCPIPLTNHVFWATDNVTTALANRDCPMVRAGEWMRCHGHRV